MRRRFLSTLVLVLVVGAMIRLGAEQQGARANYVLLPSSWPTTPVDYRVNTNFPAFTGTSAQQLAAVQNAASNWTTQTNANFSFNYAGSTGSTSIANNGTNIVFWTPSPGSGTLAVTFTFRSGGTTADTDILFYGDITWKSFDPVTGGVYDVEGVGTHEFGHSTGLGHSTRNPGDTMWASTGPGSNSVARRSLEADDIAGIEAIYGTLGVTPDPMTFSVFPTENPVFDGIVFMTATTATTSGSGVEYFFELFTTTGTGGDDSVWQGGSTYTDSGLTPNSVFGYRVKARNATTLAETAFSAPASTVTRAAAPGAPQLGTPTSTTVTLHSLDIGANPAATACAVQVNGSYIDTSGNAVGAEVWAAKSTWDGTVVNGLTPDTLTSVRVKARNLFQVQTVLGPPATLATLPSLDSCAAGTVGVNGGPTGGPFDTVFVDGDAGGAERIVNEPINTFFDLEVMKPPGAPTESVFTLWGTLGAPNSTQLFPLPFGIGDLCLTPCPAAPANPLLFTVADGFAIGGCGSLGFGVTPYALPVIIPVPLTFSVQGIIFVSGAAGGVNLATTNLLRINVTP